MASQSAGVSGLAQRYAAALYDLADEKSALDDVAADLNGLEGLLNESDDFARFVKSPVLGRDEQLAGIKAIAEKAKLNALTAQFLGVVAQNGRIFALPGMIRGFNAILAERRGLVTAEVTSAHALSDDQQASLADQLKTIVGQSVDISTKVDPSILGGLVVKVGSRMIDSSLKSKLQRLKLSMKGVG